MNILPCPTCGGVVTFKRTKGGSAYVCPKGHSWMGWEVVTSAPHPSTAVLDAAWEVVQAIENEGPHPLYHYSVMKKHRVEWPVLWRALDKLVKLHQSTPAGRQHGKTQTR